MSSIKSKLLYQLFLSSLYSIVPLIIFPYISRILGPESIGKVNFVDYTAQFILLFTSFGIPIYGVREVARIKDKKIELKLLVSELVIIHIVLSLIGLALFLSIVSFNKSIYNEQALILLAAFNILVSTFSLDWFVQGFEDFEFLSKRALSIKILTAVTVFLFVKKSNDYSIYYSILILANVLMILLNIIYILQKTRLSIKNLEVNRHIKPLTFFFITTAAISFYTNFDAIILGITVGSLSVGFYTTGLKVIRLSQNFVDSIGNVLLPRVSVLKETGQYSEIDRIINKSLQYVLFTSIPLCIYFYLVAPEIIKIVAGNEFLASISVLRILSLLPLLIGLSNIFGMQILVPFKLEKKIALAVLMGSILNIILNILLCPLWKENGAAIACVATEILVTLVLYQFIRKKVVLDINVQEIVTVISCSFLFVPIVFVCRLYFEHSLLIFTIASALCASVFLLLQHFYFKNKVICEMILFIRNMKTCKRISVRN